MDGCIRFQIMCERNGFVTRINGFHGCSGSNEVLWVTGGRGNREVEELSACGGEREMGEGTGREGGLVGIDTGVSG